MKILFAILAMLSGIAVCQAQEAKPSKETAPQISFLDGLWLLGGPDSYNAFLLQIKAGTIKGRPVELDKLSPDTLSRWAFTGKIKSLAPSAIELELNDAQLSSEWRMSSGVYSFELLNEPSGPAFLWIDFLHDPKLKDAGFYFHKVTLQSIPHA